MNLEQFIMKLQYLNPEIKIVFNNEDNSKIIYCDVPIEMLNLPEKTEAFHDELITSCLLGDEIIIFKVKSLAELNSENIWFKELEIDVDNCKGWAVLNGLYGSFSLFMSYLLTYEENWQMVKNDYKEIFSNLLFLTISGKIALLLMVKNILDYNDRLRNLDRLKNPNSKYANTTKDLQKLSRKYTTKKEKK